MQQNEKTQLFQVLQLADTVKDGSDLKVKGWYLGQLDEQGHRIIYEDRAGCEWIFYVDDTCILGDPAEAPARLRETELNDWSRFNKDLNKGQRVEISEEIYHHFLGVLPPQNWGREASYFEVGEPHHHEGGKAIHRACWIEYGRFYTGYPCQANRYVLSGHKVDPANYERTFENSDLVRYLVTFKDGSQRPYIMINAERVALKQHKNYKFIKLIGGEGYQKLREGAAL